MTLAINPIIEEHKNTISNVINGTVKPSQIVGTGYKYPKRVASGWLRKQIHNIENPNSLISEIFVTTSGKAFLSEVKAMASTTYQQLANNCFRTINNSRVVDYGVMPATIGDGYEIYVELSHKA